MSKDFFKKCTISPEEVLAGDTVEFTITLTPGADFKVKGSRIVFDMPGYLGMDRPSKWDQENGGFVEVFCDSADIDYRCLPWDMEIEDYPSREKQSYRGTAQRILVIDFRNGEIQEGDEIRIKWGWTRNGFGQGCKVTPLVLKPEFYNTIHIRYFEDGTKGLPDLGRSFKGYDRPVPDVEVPLRFKVNNREAASMRFFRGIKENALVVNDRFFNVCSDADVNKLIRGTEFKANSMGAFITGSDDIEAVNNSIPLKKTPSMKSAYKDMDVYFGDLHTHSCYSNDCIEREKQEMTPGDLFLYGRDVARLDFMAVTDHHQPWDIERNKQQSNNWSKLLDYVDSANEPGRFVAFPGIEFRCKRGDTAVVFNENISLAEISDPAMADIGEFWRLMQGHDYITIPHLHNPGRLEEYEWMECPYPGVETIFEIYSCHGAFDVEDSIERKPPQTKKRREDRNGTWFLNQGMKYGLCCNSDGHKGKTGINGLTAVYAPELTNEAIMEAIRKRRVYGTTNARIRLLFTAGDKLMGSVLKCSSENILKIDVAGEDRFKSVEIIKNGELHKRFRPMTMEFSEEERIDTSEPSYWYIRAVQVDNEIAWSSPIWFE